MRLLKIILFILSPLIVKAHVGLTYPPARKYALDFLDTFRTTGPCGMGKGSLKTVIPNNGKLKVQWHLGYPHRGSFKLFLLDKNGDIKEELTPKDQFVVSERTTQSYEVSLSSSLLCTDCTIRLVRQALEWGKTYQFQSCADVDIVAKSGYTEKCSDKGSLQGDGSCKCEAKYHGDKCQFKDECANDNDCGGPSSGKCVDLGGSILPRKQCYCPPGKFGPSCQKTSSNIKSKDFSEKDYTVTSFGATTKFYWKLDGSDHFEGIIKAKTDSYLAVGWRNLHADKSCHDEFPKDALKIKGRDFHPMDCLDVILGSVREGTYSRIGDYYTRDRSTPRLDDEFWGEKSDLTDAIGWEEDGSTYIRFRRSIKGTGGSDRPFDGELHVAWAHGQDSSKNPFYATDEIKYHGPHKGFAQIVVGSKPLSPRLQATIAAIVLLCIVFVFQALHNFTRIKKE